MKTYEIYFDKDKLTEYDKGVIRGMAYMIVEQHWPGTGWNTTFGDGRHIPYFTIYCTKKEFECLKERIKEWVVDGVIRKVKSY